MHKNSRFNIIQAPGINSRKFQVIDGQRTNSGHRAQGATYVSGELSRDEAITRADQMQAAADAGEK